MRDSLFLQLSFCHKANVFWYREA